MGTEERWAQRNSRHRGTVGTEERWAHRNSGHGGTVGTGEYRGITKEEWAQRNSGHRGTDEQLGTEEQSTQCVSCHLVSEDKKLAQKEYKGHDNFARIIQWNVKHWQIQTLVREGLGFFLDFSWAKYIDVDFLRLPTSLNRGSHFYVEQTYRFHLQT